MRLMMLRTTPRLMTTTPRTIAAISTRLMFATLPRGSNQPPSGGRMAPSRPKMLPLTHPKTIAEQPLIQSRWPRFFISSRVAFRASARPQAIVEHHPEHQQESNGDQERRLDLAVAGMPIALHQHLERAQKARVLHQGRHLGVVLGRVAHLDHHPPAGGTEEFLADGVHPPRWDIARDETSRARLAEVSLRGEELLVHPEALAVGGEASALAARAPCEPPPRAAGPSWRGGSPG